MKRTKYILRGTLLLAIVLLLINLIIKTDEYFGRIAKFKLETLKTIKTDSLDTAHKLDSLFNETTKLSTQITGESPGVRDGVRYLMLVVGLLIAVELGFFITKRRGAWPK